MEVPGVERRERVEQGHDPGRCDELNGQHEDGGGDPAPEPGERPRPLEEPEDDGEQRAPQDDGEQDALEEIGHECRRRRTVEPVSRFDAERGVDAERQAEQR